MSVFICAAPGTDLLSLSPFFVDSARLLCPPATVFVLTTAAANWMGLCCASSLPHHTHSSSLFTVNVNRVGYFLCPFSRICAHHTLKRTHTHDNFTHTLGRTGANFTLYEPPLQTRSTISSSGMRKTCLAFPSGCFDYALLYAAASNLHDDSVCTHIHSRHQRTVC